MAARCESPDLGANPAGILATLLHAADTESGASVHVFMPYADRLRAFADWVQQLWGESLGKALCTDGAPAGTGPTPLPSLGAADQHSLLQLFMEGPRDKVVVFIAPAEPGAVVRVPELFGDRSPASRLGGHTLFDIMERERIATTQALCRAGVPTMTITVGRLDARALGGLFMLFQIAVVLAGALYGVDPLDQPGVELGKRLARDLLGSGGGDAPELPQADPRRQA